MTGREGGSAGVIGGRRGRRVDPPRRLPARATPW